MGDPRKPKKQYNGPNHPWQADRIEEEKTTLREYGLLRKREIWKFNTLLENFKGQAKLLIASRSKQADIEGQALLNKLRRYGIISDTAGFDDVLGLTSKSLLERRLQTQLVRKQMALSMKQARQFILHGHVSIAGRKITSPSYLIPVAEESQLSFMIKSSLADAGHPEREKKPTEKKRPVKDDRNKFRGRRGRR